MRSKDEIKTWKTEYYLRNRDEILAKSKEYNRTHHEQRLEAARQYRIKKHDEITSYLHGYRKNNMPVCVARSRKWFDENPEYNSAYHQMRRNKRNGLPHTLTKDEWTSTKNYFNNQCAYCGNYGELHREHFISLKKGGGYVYGNIIPSCKSCNSRKHAKDFKDWYPTTDYYSVEREQKILTFTNGK